MDSLVPQIQETLDRSICSGWDRAFLESIISQLDRGKILTSKQKTLLGRVLTQNTAEEEESLEGWKDEYFTLHHHSAVQVAHYHLHHPYYRDMAQDIIYGKVPRRKRFIKMINNKYTKKVLREYAKSPRFKLGTYVKAKTSFERVHMSFVKNLTEEKFLNWNEKRHAFLNFMAKGGIILAVDNEIHSAAKGAKRYEILGIGSSLIFYIEERFLKYG